MKFEQPSGRKHHFKCVEVAEINAAFSHTVHIQGCETVT